MLVCLLAACCVLLFSGGTTQAQPSRAPDGLLTRPALQAVVEHQIDRNGAALIEALDASDPDVRARAAFALGSVQDTAAIDALGRLLRESVPGIRTDAAFALGQMPDGVPPAMLMNALRRERDPTVRHTLLRALGTTGTTGSLRTLVDLGLPSTDDRALAWAIARYGMRGHTDSTAFAWLADRLETDRDAVREQVAYVFGRLSDPTRWNAQVDSVRRALDGYASTDPAAMHLLRGLGRRADSTDRTRFLDWLQNAQDWRTRVNAARALAPFADAGRAQRALLDRLDDPQPHVRITAAQTLSEADWTERTLQQVPGWMDAHPDRWRIHAPLLDGLARNGVASRVLPSVDRWRSPETPVPFAAMLSALAPLDTARADTLLLETARASDPRVAASALSSLATRWAALDTTTSLQRADAYFNAFASATRRGDVATLRAAAPALNDPRFADRSPTDTLVATYRTLSTPADLEAMTALLDVLSEAPDTTATRHVLRSALAHPHPVVQQSAASALDTTHSATEPPPNTPALDWDALADLGPRPRLVLTTQKGRIVLELDASQAPQTVQTITRFAREGHYDGVPFHRVIANFVIQGGDFARGDGYGGPDFFLRSELTRIPYRTGTLGMANAGKDTEGSQFFITHSMQPHLDGGYTAFGRVVEGQDVVDRILANDRVLSATVEPEGR